MTRLVVNLVGDRDHGQLAESRFVERKWLPGGEHNMYELAFAAAACGAEVELRGWLHRPTFAAMSAATSAAPSVALPARRPVSGELVVVPEGWQDPLEYGRLLLSPASFGLFVLAAPGLFGWPFTERWTRPDPVTVPLAELAREEHFRAASALGFALITHSPGIARAAAAAAVSCTLLGTGRPEFTVPAAVAKEVDVAAIVDNRWWPLAEQALASLDPGLVVDRIGTVANAEVLARLARSRVLLWPSRIEGHATIPWEARSVGCVPVALDSNRFAVGLDEDHGAVVVSSVEQLPGAVTALLADPARWSQLSERGRRTAPAEVDWDSYVERVGRWLANLSIDDPAGPARSGIGAALQTQLDGRSASAQDRFAAFELQLQQARHDLTEATANQRRLIADVEYLRRDVTHFRELADRLRAELADLHRQRPVRAWLRLRKLGRRRRPPEPDERPPGS